MNEKSRKKKNEKYENRKEAEMFKKKLFQSFIKVCELSST